MSEADTLLRELNHRVNNNFQIVVSLMNLKKRLLPVERQDDIRFIEEHVQSMAVAYRLIYARGEVLEVRTSDLIADVVLGLRLIAKLPVEQLNLQIETGDNLLNLDQAIALALYFAVVLPPYLDVARVARDSVSVGVTINADRMSVSVVGAGESAVPMDFLRERLMHAYISQLGASQETPIGLAHHTLNFDMAQLAPSH